MANTTIMERLKIMEGEISQANKIVHSIEVSKASLEGNKSQKIESLKELGINNPLKAKEELEAKKKALFNEVDSLEKMIPSDIIEKFKGINFNNVDSILTLKDKLQLEDTEDKSEEVVEDTTELDAKVLCSEDEIPF